MPHSARGFVAPFALALLLIAPGLASGWASEELDQYEEKSFARCAERATRATKGDRARWVEVLEEAFPGKVPDPMREEEYGAWFVMLASKDDEWRRPTEPKFAELYEKVLQRLELGPMPTIKRDEFMKYARHVLNRDRERNLEADKELLDAADRVFRALDLSGDGVLEGDELTTRLRADKLKVDADGNGRIDRDEYRGYFKARVATVAAANAAKSGDGKPAPAVPGKGPATPGKAGSGLPDWFTTLDENRDSQISLYEWRTGNRPIEAFNEMDLDGDGLITREEYLRFVKLKEIELNQKKLEEMRP